MKKRDLIFTGTILVLVGILLGLVITMFRSDKWSSDHATVRVTEVTRSVSPLLEADDLEKMDSRFLFQRVADITIPSVVFIETTVQVDREIIEEEEETDLWHRFLPRRARTVGSGVILSKDGYILTNNHVVDSAVSSGIHVTLQDKRSYPARIIGADPSTDLAVIRIEAENLQPVLVGNSDHVRIGEWVLAIGNPFRLQSTVTAGIVSALSRDVQIINDSMRIESFIQTDAAINRGNSGGALVNTSGELIGINTAIASQSGTYQGYGFAVPSNLALKVAEDLIEFGETRRGMLGVSIESVNHSIARDLGMEQIRGVLVVSTLPEGAAQSSGIERNDVILEVNGTAVNEANQLQERVAMYRPGDVVELQVWRQGDVLTYSIALREMPRPAPEPEASPVPGPGEMPDFNWEQTPGDSGMEGEEELLFEQGFTLRQQKNESSRGGISGLALHDVTPGSQAWNRGLRPGSYLLAIEGVRVQTLEEARIVMAEALKDPGPVRLRIRFPDGAEAHFFLNETH